MKLPQIESSSLSREIQRFNAANLPFCELFLNTDANCSLRKAAPAKVTFLKRLTFAHYP